MQHLSTTNLLQFVSTLKDEVLKTSGGRAKFTVSVTDKGLTVVPLSSGIPRPIELRRIGKVCDQYILMGSNKAGDYHSMSFDASYLLALIRLFETAHDFSYPEEVSDETFFEGSVQVIKVNAYERDPRARNACIAAHGTSCTVCSFSFGAKYGPLAEGYIHVHHLKPLAQTGKIRSTDPVNDLRPVCPNCHAVLHLRTPPFSIDELRSIIANHPEHPTLAPVPR